MPDWIKTLQQKIVEWWITIPLGITAYLLSKIYGDLVVLVLPEIMNKVPSILLLRLLLLSLLLNLALFFTIYIKRNRYHEFEPTINYGIYWDYMYHPLCPTCKAPLHQEELTRLQLIYGPPKLICPNGHFNKHLVAGGEKLYPDKIRYDFLKINKMLIKNEDE